MGHARQQARAARVVDAAPGLRNGSFHVAWREERKLPYGACAHFGDTMRWQQLLELARDDLDAQQRVLDTALAALRQIDDPRLHACVVAAVPAARSLCELLDAFGVTVSDELARELDRVALGVESAWLSEQRARGVAPEPIGSAAHLRTSPG